MRAGFVRFENGSVWLSWSAHASFNIDEPLCRHGNTFVFVQALWSNTCRANETEAVTSQATHATESVDVWIMLSLICIVRWQQMNATYFRASKSASKQPLILRKRLDINVLCELSSMSTRAVLYQLIVTTIPWQPNEQTQAKIKKPGNGWVRDNRAT